MLRYTAPLRVGARRTRPRDRPGRDQFASTGLTRCGVAYTVQAVTVVDEIRAWARQRGDHPALRISRGCAELETISYTELVARFERVAARIESEIDPRYSRIGLVAPQGPEFIENALGILAAGACLVPIADDTPEEAFAPFLERSHLHALLRADKPGLDRFDPAFHAEAEFAALEPAYLRFTSGTTDQRKGVVLSHRRIVERLTAANRGMQISSQDRILWLLPMAHHFVVSILLYLRNGATILLPASSLAEPVLDLCAETDPTVFYASPYHYGLLGKDPSERQLDSVRLAVSTAEGLREQTAMRFMDRFGIALTQALGIIEVGLPAMNRLAAATKPTSVGRPLPDYDVWLRADDGSAVEQSGPDRCGEVCIRGPGMFDAYLDPWVSSRSLLGDEGFRTGDQGWFDDDGDLHLAGRRANRINMAGMKFFCEEVEAVLDRHPGVARSRVSSRDHPHLGQISIAEYVPETVAPSARELTDFCKRHLARYKIPRQFKPVAELPTTPTGKIRRT